MLVLKDTSYMTKTVTERYFEGGLEKDFVERLCD